uniref:Conotoxin n=1 Tax=Conus betulinus TaxID=89764 RepID=A0A142C1F9_CONBE|nr:conotoxin [Conus betulinus]
MFSHTSVSFPLFSIMVLGMVATVICSCGSDISNEICEEPDKNGCSCPNHNCCILNPPKRDQCMTQHMCYILLSENRRRRSTQMQERFLRMPRGLAD